MSNIKEFKITPPFEKRNKDMYTLTTDDFYNHILPKLREYITKKPREKLIFDFSKIKKINPLVIPNLLCVGVLVNNQVGIRPKIDIPPSYDGSKIMGFLHSMDFYVLADEIFEKVDQGKLGSGSTPPPEVHKVLRFRIGTENDTHTAIKNLVNETLNSVRAPEDTPMLPLRRQLRDILQELVENSWHKGKSDCFVSFQVISSDQKAYIAAADSGMGIFSSLEKKVIEDKLDGENQECIKTLIRKGRKKGEKTSHADLYAIIAAILYRRKPTSPHKEVYGISHVLNSCKRLGTQKDKYGIEFGTKICIHSESVRLVIDHDLNKLLPEILPEGNAQDIAEQYLDIILKSKDSFTTEQRFRGVHFEMEIPLPLRRYKNR